MIISMLMCPRCHNTTSLEGEPQEGVMYPCRHCETSFKLINVDGQMMTANADADEEAIIALLRSRVPFDIFDLINGGSNKGEEAKMKTPPNVPDIMAAAADTFRERNKTYGDSYKQFGEVMKAMFPNGLSAVTVDDWNRLGVFVMMVSKLTRYSANMEREGGHTDSAHDLGVYSFMLEELTRLRKGEY